MKILSRIIGITVAVVISLFLYPKFHSAFAQEEELLEEEIGEEILGEEEEFEEEVTKEAITEEEVEEVKEEAEEEELVTEEEIVLEEEVKKEEAVAAPPAPSPVEKPPVEEVVSPEEEVVEEEVVEEEAVAAPPAPSPVEKPPVEEVVSPEEEVVLPEERVIPPPPSGVVKKVPEKLPSALTEEEMNAKPPVVASRPAPTPPQPSLLLRTKYGYVVAFIYQQYNFPVKYTVQAGDDLHFIAAKFYGNARLWKVIYSENKNIIGPNPNVLTPGIVLTIPPLSFIY